MIECDYIYNGTHISRETLFSALEDAVVNSNTEISQVLYSKADKKTNRTEILEGIKAEGRLESHQKNRFIIDGDVSYEGNSGELSLSAFFDSPFFSRDNSIYQKKEIEDYINEEKERLIKKEGLTEEEATNKINWLIDNWEKIAEDGRLLHRLVIDSSIGYHERDWVKKSEEFVKKALTLVSKDSPFRNETILKNLYKELAEFYRDTKGNYPDSEQIRNINLTSKLKDLDQKLFSHIDYAFIDGQGKLHIYNFKLTTQKPGQWAKAKVDKYKLEGAFIKQMLIANGIQISNIGEIEYNIVPIMVQYNESFNNVNKVQRLSSIRYDFDEKSRYIARSQDNVARQFVEIPLGIENIQKEDLDTSDKLFQFGFPLMEVSQERIYKSTLQWIKEAPSVSDTESLVIKEVNEKDCRYRVILYGKTYDIKDDFSSKENNQKIIELVEKHLNKLNAELGDYSSKLTNAITRAFKHKVPYIEDLNNSSYITRILSKYLPVDQDSESEWEFIPELAEYNILLFKNKNNQIDVVSLSSDDFQQLGDFRRGATNILGSYLLDGNKDASTLRGDMGNIQLIRTMIMLNQLLPNLKNYKLGEIIALSNAKSGQARRHYIREFNENYFKHFLKIIKRENANELKDIVNNISKAEFSNPIDDIISTFQKMTEGISNQLRTVFEQYGVEELSKKEDKVDALFDLMEQLNNDFLRNKTPEEIYNIAHPRSGSSVSQKEKIAAKLYELVSNAYHYYSGQTIQYQKDLSKLDIYSFTAPTIPDYNVRLVVNNMQTTLDSIAYEENKEYNKNISPIVMEYYKACGYSDIQNLTIGNQLHLFDNLYQDSENLIFKNPYDETNNLKSHERLFLKKALFYLNQVKLSRFEGAEEKFTDYNDPAISKFINNNKNGEKYLWVPLTRASNASQRQQSLKNKVDRIKRGFRIACKSKDWYTEVISKMSAEERQWMDEDIKSLQLRNSFDIGEREYSERQNYINNQGKAFFETNVENIMTEYMTKAIETNKLNKFLTATKSILLQLHIMGNESEDARKIVEKETNLIKDYITQNTFNTSTMDPTNQKIVAALSGTKRSVTFLNLAGNMVSFFRDIINGFGENFLRAATKFQTDIKAKNIKDAYEYVFVNGRSNAMNVNLLSKLNIRYRLSNTDLARIKERLRTGRNGLYNWDNWAYSTLRSPDFLNRMTLFVARCMQDGVWEAYSMKDGELIYDVKKDKRFEHFIHDHKDHPDYIKQKALFILHINNWNKEHPGQNLDWSKKQLPEPYSDQEILAIKNVANNIYGSYDKSLKAQYEHTAPGWAFTMYTTWMNGMWNNWLMKPDKYNINRMQTEQDTNENGEPLYMLDDGTIVVGRKNQNNKMEYIIEETGEIISENVNATPVLKQIPIITQGIWYTLKDMFRVFQDKDNGGVRAAFKYMWSNEVDKRNFLHGSSQAIIALLFMLLFKIALTPAYNESKKKSNNLPLVAKLMSSISYKSFNGARDSFAGPLNVVEYFGEQMDPPIYKVPIKLVKDAGNTIFGDKTFLSLITGNIALARTFKDVV